MTRKKIEIYYSIQTIEEGANGETGNPRYLIFPPTEAGVCFEITTDFLTDEEFKKYMNFGFDEQMKLLKEKFNKDLVFEEDLRKKRYKRVDVTLHDKIK